MDPGLCGRCRHCQLVETARSVFYLCRLSFSDSRFRKYPPIPVHVCAGFTPAEAAPASPDGPLRP